MFIRAMGDVSPESNSRQELGKLGCFSKPENNYKYHWDSNSGKLHILSQLTLICDGTFKLGCFNSIYSDIAG